MTAYARNKTIKGTVRPETFDDLVRRDQAIAQVKEDLRKAGKEKPEIAKYQSLEKKT